jgi:hypothetical protein
MRPPCFSLVFINTVFALFSGGFSEDHPCIQSFWRAVEDFNDTQKRQLLKFVTSCSRPPLLGFKVSIKSEGRVQFTCVNTGLHSLESRLLTYYLHNNYNSLITFLINF